VDAYEIHLFVLQGMQIDCLTLNARAELNEYEAEGHGQRVSLLDKNCFRRKQRGGKGLNVSGVGGKLLSDVRGSSVPAKFLGQFTREAPTFTRAQSSSCQLIVLPLIRASVILITV
jgi:hypothetical protein